MAKARRHVSRMVNRRRAKNVAVLRELQEFNEWILAIRSVTPREGGSVNADGPPR